MITRVEGELILTVVREGDGWHILIEGDPDCDRDAIPVTVSTANEGDTATWIV